MAEPRLVTSCQPPIGGYGAKPRRLREAHPVAVWLSALLLAVIGSLLFVNLVQSVRTSNARNVSFIPPMAFPGQSWERSTPESVGVNSRKLDQAISWFEDRAPSDGVNELVVARYGKLIWAGSDAENAHGTWSLTKVFSGALLGALADEGLCGPDTLIGDILPEMRAAYPEVTLRHLVTMSSGYQAEGDWPPRDLSNHNGGSYSPFDPSPVPQFAPGTHFSYWDSAMNLYGLAITKTAGQSMQSLFQNRIGGPIGIRSEAWNWRQLGEFEGIPVNGGSGNLGKHVEISALDVARFGHLMLNRGRWDGQQVIGESWVNAATSIQISAETPLGGPIVDRYGKKFPFDGRGTYGFNWWVNGVKPDGTRLWPGIPASAFGGIGFNNNRLFVIPEWDMVIVRLGQDGKDRRIKREEFVEFLQQIGKAIEN